MGELALLRAQMGGQVNVEVDAAPSMDLNQAMQEIREHYEAVAAKNRRDLEAWYQGKMAVVETEVVTHNESLMKSRTELKEPQGRYSAQLSSLQDLVTSLENQLSQLHANISANRQDYDMLLDIKTRLEMEIAEYRRLLDGEDDSTKQV